ncbi:hypothetical protein BaRGS_00031934 [Batillaria attramentaria]|uniref:Integrase zinc-binding domain-containing protein n=1 Tax=Batillaria attramentaria TaxID=370345 RepID=A0ABD0JQR9_9CAEN
MGVKRTLERARQDFYWPGMESDVRRYCQTCDACQRTTLKGRNTRIPLGKVPLVQTPLEKVGVDLKGLNGMKVANKRLTPLERRWSRELSSNSWQSLPVRPPHWCLGDGSKGSVDAGPGTNPG